jgi:hypothetical protein
MVTKSRLLDRLLDESRKNREIHPYLKRMILSATQTALRKVVPDSYYKKCQGAAAAIFMILRSLRIQSSIFGGSVSWLYGAVDENGVARQSRCGFWSQNPALPTPHAWVVTEYGSLIDLTCSYFHYVYEENEKNLQSRDVLPIIWMKTENLTALPALRYSPAAKFQDIDLQQCDELARQVVGLALAAFWGHPSLETDLPPDADPEVVVQKNVPDLGNEVLDGPQSLERLRQSNGWVARNCSEPSSNALAMSPGIMTPAR